MNDKRIDIRIIIPNQTCYLSMIGRISDVISKQLQDCHCVQDGFENQVNTALTEALVNAIRHANEDNPDDFVEVRFEASANELLLQVFDHGAGFDLNSVPDSFMDNTDDLQDHGRGLFIMRSLMDSVKYSKIDSGNVLEMRKKLR